MSAPKEPPVKAAKTTAGEAKKDAPTAVADEEKIEAKKTDVKKAPAADNAIEDDSKTSEEQA